MDYNEERCAAHGKRLEDIEKDIYGNGNAGIKLELQRLKDWRELMDKQAERRERKQDAVIVALIIQSILMVATKLFPLFGK